MVLYGPGRPVLPEGALGHPGKDLGHGVHPVVGLLLQEAGRLHPVLAELAAEEEVREEALPDHVHQVQDVGAKDAGGREGGGGKERDFVCMGVCVTSGTWNWSMFDCTALALYCSRT